MAKVYPRHRHQASAFPLASFIRASSLHIGAAAAAASLHRDLVEDGPLPAADFDHAYAVARLTPGTNLLAMYTLLGEYFSGWRGAAIALMVGASIPAALVVLIAAAYVRYATHPLAAGVMQGARAGALAVFMWAVVRLLRPQLVRYGRRGLALASAVVLVTIAFPVPPFVVLLVAGGIGAIVMKDER